MNNGKQVKKAPIEFEASSGNVFRDLGLDQPELLLAKSTLIVRIHGLIEDYRLTEKAAADLIGIERIDLHEILRGDLDRFSKSKLKQFLKTLKNSVDRSRIEKGTAKGISRVGK